MGGLPQKKKQGVAIRNTLEVTAHIMPILLILIIKERIFLLKQKTKQKLKKRLIF